MKKESSILLIICALAITSRAQITAVGVKAGITMGLNKTYAFQAANYGVVLEDMQEFGRLNFGAMLEHNLFTHYSLSHTVLLHQYYINYFVIQANSDLRYPTGAGVYTVTYTPLFRLVNKGGLRFLAGPGIDINSLSESPKPDTPDDGLNQIVDQLQYNVKPVVYYIGTELGYRAGRLELALKFNYSLNSFAEPITFNGVTYGIPTRSAFFFLNIGFLVYNKKN